MLKQIVNMVKFTPGNAFLKTIQQRPILTSINQINFCTNSLKKCWKCGILKSPDDLFCNKCGVIQSPEQTDNYFKVFGLNSSFNLNLNDLTQKYRSMQKLLHPDKFSNKSEEEKEVSAEYSSLVNKAYSTLQVPLNRALHLLLLNNETISEDDKASDPTFLMEIMELNEEVEDATSIETLKSLNKKNNEKIESLVKLVTKDFDDSQIHKAKETIIKMKYYNSISKRINHLLREKGAVD